MKILIYVQNLMAVDNDGPEMVRLLDRLHLIPNHLFAEFRLEINKKKIVAVDFHRFS